MFVARGAGVMCQVEDCAFWREEGGEREVHGNQAHA